MIILKLAQKNIFFSLPLVCLTVLIPFFSRDIENHSPG